MVGEGTTFHIYLLHTHEEIDIVNSGEQPEAFPKGTERDSLIDDEPLI